MESKVSAKEILQARIDVQSRKMSELAMKCLTAKEQCDEMCSLMTEMKENEVDDLDIQKISEKAKQRMKENTDLFQEWETMKVKLEENKEMLEILSV